MHTTSERMLEITTAIAPTSRRGLLPGGGRLAGWGALGAALAGAGLHPAAAQDATETPEAEEESPFESEVDVLNYALTLEHLEATFYRQGLEQFADQAFLDAGLQSSVRDYLVEIGEHEAAHVETLTQVITELGGDPVAEAEYDFGVTDLASFLATAAALENTGVAAYTGAAQYLIEEDELLTAALTIHGVEARHAAYLNVLSGASPFPDAFDAPLTPDEDLAIAGPFIVSEGTGDDTDETPEAEGTAEGGA